MRRASATHALTPAFPRPSLPRSADAWACARPSSSAAARPLNDDDAKRRAALSRWSVPSGSARPTRATAVPPSSSAASSQAPRQPTTDILDGLLTPRLPSKWQAPPGATSKWTQPATRDGGFRETGGASRPPVLQWGSSRREANGSQSNGRASFPTNAASPRPRERPSGTLQPLQRDEAPHLRSDLLRDSPFQSPLGDRRQGQSYRGRDDGFQGRGGDVQDRMNKWVRPPDDMRGGSKLGTSNRADARNSTSAGLDIEEADVDFDSDGYQDVDISREVRRSWKDRKTHKFGKERGSLLDPRALEEEELEYQDEAATQTPKKVRKVKEVEAVIEKDVYIPNVVSVGNLARILAIRHKELLRLMQRAGMEHRNADHLLSAEDASLLAMELGYNPVIDDEAAFDIYPEPAHPDPATLPHRPPIVTIMGHVDHGKTTLLDTLRSASVAKGEAGGITQHIGAFSVSVKTATESSGIRTITFLDTPGHAAFTAMRARGASVTDIIVCVVAADDGVMPQTKEVLELAKREEGVQLVIAINKVDMPGVDVNKVKNELLREGVQLEEFAGDIPSVEVSGMTGQGLDNLIETISAMAEVADLRAEQKSKAEGYVLESKVDKGRGPMSTVLVMRGTLKSGSCIVAGTTWCKVRQMVDDKGRAVREALPGTPVTIAGWKDLPVAGDEVLEAVRGEDAAKKAVSNRQRELEKKALLEDVEKINEKRREERLDRQEELAAKDTGIFAYPDAPREEGPKELRLVIKGDVSGTVEAVVGAVETIGNDEVKVRIVSSGVGDVNESDLTMAGIAEGMVVGFNVGAGRAIQQEAHAQGIALYIDDVIYRVMEEVRKRASALLSPAIEKHVKGEATIQQVFNVTMKKATNKVAGCRVTNGAIDSKSRVRVLRLGEPVWEGMLAQLKQAKKEITEARKGMECGMFFQGFVDFQEGDMVQAIQVVEVPRSL